MMTIHEYHKGRDPIFRSLSNSGLTKSSFSNPKLLYIGAEIETDYIGEEPDPDSEDDEPDPFWASDYLESKLERCDFLTYTVPTFDGSLSNGCEFVSDPLTIEAWMEVKPSFREGFKHLLDVGLRAHDTETCGLHFHVSRSFFKANEEAWSALLLVVEQNWPDMTRIARRKTNHYAQRVLGPEFNRDCKERHEYVHKEGSKLWAKTDGSRYVAVNFRNENTIEFRFFRGTLNIETFYASLQFIWNLCNLCASITIKQAVDISITDILEYKEWPELMSYASKRKFTSNYEISSEEESELTGDE